ncbi:phage holin family protein [Corynebacterium sp. KPL2861]|uniref:phage holin family protein n=1 Tax=unclassified Corynebacterium TaxID=2624378 RepID=UPI001E3D7435|nr:MULTISPECIES: phage holin family protein [Corynebacterium]MDK8474697.1 phage holin family protein [Corynebacterium sp. MSK078]MDK8815530.1 phage holin family protein [Corynebacterium sp. MSK073]WKS61412.1 phage holin family protein [Corynebacterium accolens]
MVSNDGLFTDGTDQFAPKVNSIPLSDVDASSSETSIGKLVSNATEQMSQLVRSEVELAKTELAESAKKGGIGAGFFGAAGTIALYSSFFFFFFLAELLALWLDRWAAFLIVFLVMIVAAGALALLGVKNVKKVKAPQKTIDSTKELKNLIPGKAQKSLDRKDTHGLYT